MVLEPVLSGAPMVLLFVMALITLLMYQLPKNKRTSSVLLEPQTQDLLIRKNNVNGTTLLSYMFRYTS